MNNLDTFFSLIEIKEEEKEYDVITEEEWNAHVESIKPKKPTAAQKARKEKLAQISKAKAYLSSTDYCVIKIAEGVATAEEYAEVLVKRAEARTTINTLEEELA